MLRDFVWYFYHFIGLLGQIAECQGSIFVKDINDNSPVFEQNEYVIEIDEGKRIKFKVTVYAHQILPSLLIQLCRLAIRIKAQTARSNTASMNRRIQSRSTRATECSSWGRWTGTLWKVRVISEKNGDIFFLLILRRIPKYKRLLIKSLRTFEYLKFG